jgi:hypothetical protein
MRVLQPVSEVAYSRTSEPCARRCYRRLKIPPAPGLKVCSFCHGERRRKARKKIAVGLAIGHTMRTHQALSRPYALSGFLEVIHRLFEDGVFVGHE